MERMVQAMVDAWWSLQHRGWREEVRMEVKERRAPRMREEARGQHHHLLLDCASPTGVGEARVERTSSSLWAMALIS